MSNLLTVFGATGAQGGALIAHVLQHPKLSKMYQLRGITRDDTKPAAIALKEKGVEVVKVLLDTQKRGNPHRKMITDALGRHER